MYSVISTKYTATESGSTLLIVWHKSRGCRACEILADVTGAIQVGCWGG